VRREKEKGVPIIFGDATLPHILEAVHLSEARAVVIAISNTEATKTIIRIIRLQIDSLYIVVRAKYVHETAELIALGADEVIPEEFETSIHMFARVLQSFLMPEDDIHQLIDKIRTDNYQLLRDHKKIPKTFKNRNLEDFNITCLRINSDSSKFLSKPLKNTNLRSEYGINILGIKRRNKMLDSVQPDEVLKQGDVIYIQGNQGNIEQFHNLIK